MNGITQTEGYLMWIHYLRWIGEVNQDLTIFKQNITHFKMRGNRGNNANFQPDDSRRPRLQPDMRSR